MKQIDELPEDISVEMTIDENNLAREYSRFTPIYARWLYARSEVQGSLLQKKRLLEQAESAERLKVRQDNPKITVDDMKATLAVHPACAKLARQVSDLQATEEIMRAVIEALRAKKDMLVSLGAQQRALLNPLARSSDGLDLSDG